MLQDFFLPAPILSEAITGYLFYEGSNEYPEHVDLYENSISIGVPLGEPFNIIVGKNLNDIGSFVFSFNKPLLINGRQKQTHIWVEGEFKLCMAIFSPKAQKKLRECLQMEEFLNLCPLCRTELSLFNLAVRNKLRRNESPETALPIIENELVKFFNKLPS